ncbi:MAG: prepilin peptidase [Armatimonadetes bacterium]|nr:prepilin peptidase [Armatimonadota bacterium]
MFYPWTWVVGLFLGATIGSFLNVVIYRMPRGISLSNPKNSFCPNCKHQLGPADLFPLLSWLILGGKCRYCKVKVPPRYFLVELLNGIIWAAIWYQYMVVRWDVGTAVAYAAVASSLVAIIFIDWEFYIIPDQINAFLFFVGLAYNYYLFASHRPTAFASNGLPNSIAGALLGVGILWFIAMFGRLMFGKDAMGHGDIKMVRGFGAVLFPVMTLWSIALAVLAGAILGGVQALLLKGDSYSPAEAAGGSKTEPGDDAKGEADEVYEPESIGSLIKCGIGYVLCLDIIGLFIPKFYISYFGEDPYLPVQEMEDYEVERTMIPFGPYLAMGAIAAVVFQHQLMGVWNAYLAWVTGSRG